jgi:hypothetical protein
METLQWGIAMVCERIEVEGKGGNTLLVRIGHVRDALHLVWWMTNIMHFSFFIALLAFAKISLKSCSSVLTKP